MFSLIPKSVIAKFVLDYATKAIHAGLLILIAKGIMTGDQSLALESGAGVAITIAINAALNAATASKAATVEKKVDAIAKPK